MITRLPISSARLILEHGNIRQSVKPFVAVTNWRLQKSYQLHSRWYSSSNDSNEKSKFRQQIDEVRPKISKQFAEANKQLAEVRPKLSKQLAEANKQIAEAKPHIAEFTRDLYTIPNILTMTRIATTPLIGYLIVNGNTHYALLVFAYSCFTDFIDGYIARRFNQKSIIGSIIDPLADKFLMTVCTVSLAYISSIPTVVASLIIGRDVMLSFMSFYYRYKSIALPKTLGKFLDIKSNPTITVHPSTLGKVNTGLQMVYIGGLVVKPIIDPIFDLSLFFEAFGVLVSITTVLSGATYIFGKNAFKYVKKPQV